MKNLIIIDGNSIVNRAYYGVRPLSTKTGIPTNAIFGFMNIMLKYIDEYKPDYHTYNKCNILNFYPFHQFPILQK